MKERMKRLIVGICTVGLVASSCTVLAAENVGTASGRGTDTSTKISNLSYIYAEYRQSKTDEGFEAYKGATLRFTPEPSSGKGIELDGAAGILNSEEYPETNFKIQAPSDGMYRLGCRFRFLNNNGFEGKRQILIDGKSPYMEADNVAFYRYFKDTTEPTVNEIGDEVLPATEEILEWRTNDFYDNLGRYSEPLTFALTAGEHTVTVKYYSQEIAIEYLYLAAPTVYPSYEEYISSVSGQSVTGFREKYQAEKIMTVRNKSSIGLTSDGDPGAMPSKPGYIVMNTVGGYSFREGGQSISFKINVKKAGLYALSLRVKQSWNNKMNSYRRVELNGEVPFAEMSQVAVHYANGWKNLLLSDKEGKPYLFYMNEGDNILTLTAVLGPNTETEQTLNYALDDLSTLLREITLITGNSPDANYNYELETAIPNLKERLQKIIDYIDKAIARCNDQNGGKATPTGNSLGGNSSVLREMKDDPKEISRRLDEINTVLTNIGSVISQLKEQPVQLDYIELLSPEQAPEKRGANFWDYCYSTLMSFVVSFGKDYNALSVMGDAKADKVIDVWVARGREWAEILKEMTNSEFVTKSKIAVQYNVVASGALSSSGSASLLLLSICSGTQPDVAIGGDSAMPVEYAMRGVIADLSKMEGFEETLKLFPEGITVPLEYEGGTYALPETMGFSAIYYRTDIFKQYNLKLPKTWDEVFTSLIPSLNEKGMQFSMGNSLIPFLLANGGTYYRKEADGWRSALDTKEAYDAFKTLTDAFVVYGVPTSANFFNRFRTGEMPIGIGDSGTYISLYASAPELSGKWALAPLPDYKREDGSLHHAYSGIGGTTIVVLEGTGKEKEGWEYLRWLMSDDTQTEYAQKVESRIGLSGRWMSANKQAFLSLPWDADTVDVIKDNWNNLIGIPYVPGAYFTSRHTGNAWNRVVLNGMLPRESLEKAVEDINFELIRKQKQLDKKKQR